MNCCKRWEYYLREKLFSFYQNDFAANTLTVPQCVLRENLRWIWSQLSTIVLRYWVSLFSKDQSDALPKACLAWRWPVTLWKASWVLCSPGEKIKRSHPCWSVYSPVDTWGLSSVLCSVNLIREATGIAHRSAVFAFSKSVSERWANTPFPENLIWGTNLQLSTQVVITKNTVFQCPTWQSNKCRREQERILWCLY